LSSEPRGSSGPPEIGYFRREELPCSWDDAGSVYGQFDERVKFGQIAAAVNKRPTRSL